MQIPTVSIVMPAYNHAAYIGRAISSVIAQTFGGWELIIIDDGSTDDTARVIAQFDDPRITYIHQFNRGVKELARTINVGVARAQGTFITMMASDDTWPSGRLECQLPLFDEAEVVLVYGRGHLIDATDRILGMTSAPPAGTNIENRPVGSALHQMFLSNYIFQPSVLLRRSALASIGGYLQPPGLLAEDYPTHMALALVGEFRFIDAPLAGYRMHSAQMTRNHYEEMVETDVPYVLDFFRKLSDEDRGKTGWTEPTLATYLTTRLSNSYFEVGRRYLLAKRWRDARRQFIRVAVGGDVRSKGKAVVGLVCSVAHMNLEWLARTTGRATLE